MNFYAYTHARPDGRVFYVGKGTDRRARDMAPARRKLWHMNIVRKYGRKNIAVSLYPTGDESQAFELEKFLISEFRDSGVVLINLTDGGEGCSGRSQSEKQREVFARGRGRAHFERMPLESRQSVLDGLARGRLNSRAWRKSPAGKAHIMALVAVSVLKRKAKPSEHRTCTYCGAGFEARNWRAAHCDENCQQRHRRSLGGK